MLSKTKTGMLMRVETAKRGGFPRFEIYYRNSCFDAKECEAKIKNAAVLKRIQYPKGVAITLVTPNGNVGNCGNLELAIAISVLCKSQRKEKILIASSMSAAGDCVASDILPASVVRACEQNGIEDIILSESARGRIEAELEKNPDHKPLMRLHYVKDIVDAYQTFAKIEGERRKNEICAHDVSEETKACPVAEADPFSNVVGLDNCKRLIALALAGRHSLMISGPSGSGKSLLLDCIARIPLVVPERIRQDAQENLMILKSNGSDLANMNVAGEGDWDCFSAVCDYDLKELSKSGRGGVPSIIAETGKVFLADDITELSKSSMSLLKACMSRNAYLFRNESYSLSVSVIATARLCRCGKFGSRNQSCECGDSARRSYRRRLDETLGECFDLTCDISEEELSEEGFLAATQTNDHGLLTAIRTAESMQEKRYGECDSIRFNSDLVKSADRNIKTETMEKAVGLFGGKASLRKILRAYSIARTIADMNGRENIDASDVELSLILVGRRR